MIQQLEVRDWATLSRLIIIDTFISCIWTTQYYDKGEFELVVSYSDELFNAIKVGNYLMRTGGEQYQPFGVIETVKYSYNANEGRLLTVTGKLGISLLDRRLIYAWSNYHPQILTYCTQGQRVELAARNAVTTHAINPARAIAHLTLGVEQGLLATSNKHVSTYQNLYEALTVLLAGVYYGHRILYNSLLKQLDYEVYNGTDRSKVLIFSANRENIISFSYTEDESQYKNNAYIGGEGEGLNRFVTATQINGGFATSTERREMFYGASSDKEDNVTSAAYAEILKTEARKENAAYSPIISACGEIDLTTSGLVYGEDFNVGDIITIEDIVTIQPRITSVIESQDENGYSVTVEFNEDVNYDVIEE